MHFTLTLTLHVAQALLLDLPNPEGLTLWLHLNKEEGGLPLTKVSSK